MSGFAYTIALVGAAAVVLIGLVLVRRARDRARLRAERRAAAVERLAVSLERVADELARVPARTGVASPALVDAAYRESTTAVGPADPGTGLPARAALVDALVRDVAVSRREGRRLGLALVDVEARGTELEPAMAEVARAAQTAAPEGSAFRSGERSLALVLPASGRADAIAVVARIEASLGGRPPVRAAVAELEPDEDAAALLARVAALPR